MFGEVWGPAPARVLALHGWRRSHADFKGVVGPDAPGGPLPAAAVDLPGFGATPPPPGAWGSPEYAGLVAAVVGADPAFAPPLVVVGHSLGGRVAVALAASRPDLVSGLVLCGAPIAGGPAPPPRPAAAFRALRALHRFGLVSDRRMEAARQRHGSEDYRAAEGVMRQVLVRMVSERYDRQLAGLRCPVALVWGDDDTAAPLEVARMIEQSVAGARLTICPRAGHLVPLSAPAVLRGEVERLIGG